MARTGLVSALAACFQLAAGFFPGPGHVLSALGTLPIALAAVESPTAGMAGLFAASGIVFIIQPPEAPILLLMTGPLGWVLGWARKTGRSKVCQVAVGGVVLAAGMLIVTYVLGMPALGDFVSARPTSLVAGLYLVFAVLYTWLWVFSMSRLWPRMRGWSKTDSR